MAVVWAVGLDYQAVGDTLDLVQWVVYALAAVGVVVVLRRGSRPHDDTPDGALATA